MADDVRLEIVATDKTGAAIASAKRNLGSLEQTAQSVNRSFANIGQTATGVFGGMAAFAAASGVSSAMVNIGRTAFDAYAKAERLRQSLQAMSAKEIMQAGGANSMAQALQLAGTRAKELQSWIERMAVQSPFGQEDVAAALRMGMAYGFNSREAQRLTQIMLDYSAATGQSGETMQRVALALGQIRSRGKLAGQELNQLTEAGINVRQILADAFGKTTAEITTMTEKGLISADDAIKAITNSLETDFKGAAAASATSMAGLVATFQDISQLRLRDLFAGVFESAQPYIVEIADVLSAPEFAAGVAALGAGIGAFTTDKLGAAAGYIQQISDAANSAPKDTPGWMTGLAALTPGQFDSVLATLTTIQATMAALGEGDFETSWKIVAEAQDPEVKEWMLWFQGDAKREVEAVVKFVQTTSYFWANYGEWIKGEAEREVAVAVEFVNGESAFWTAWAPYIMAGEQLAMQVATSFVEAAGSFATLWTSLQAQFAEPVMIVGSWASNALGGLWDAVQGWFNAKPVTVNVQTSYTPSTQPYGLPTGTQLPVDVTAPYPSYTPGKATGSGFFAGGLALVGEVGPELVSLPRGAQIMRNADTRAVLGNVPRFAEGNTPLGGALKSLLEAMGLWKKVSEPTNMYGVQGAEVMAKAAGKEWKQAAENTETAFGDAAAATVETFSREMESALKGVEGVFGTSKVTADQMRQADAGVPQNFADNYLRRLTDEVMNGVDWAGVDIGDAAARAGINPNLPAEMILELFRSAWEDSSLFANPENLELIDKGAVQEAIAKQQAAALGEANILAYFGDPAIASQAMGGMAGAIGSAASEPDNVAALADAGYVGAAKYYAGWTSFMSEAAVVPPGGAPAGVGVPAVGVTAPGKAVGVGRWAGGWMKVHKDEAIYLPQGAGVATAAESRRMGGGGSVTINANVNSRLDAEAITNQVIRRLKQRAN
jgi:tape measure domain-containing protein